MKSVVVDCVWYRGAINLVLRDEKLRKHKRRVKGFTPWFYIRAKDGKYRTLTGQPAKRFHYQDRKPEIEPGEWDLVYEYDLSPEDRFLISKGIYHGVDEDLNPADVDIPLRRFYFDIEVASPSVPSVEQVKYPICCIAGFDSYTRKGFVFSWRADIPKEVVKGSFVNIYRFNTESEMLNRFIDFLTTYLDPDILLGWNIDGFDFPYLFNRCRVLGIDHTRLSPFEEVRAERRRVTIKGRHVVDLMKVYKGYHFYEVRDTSLEGVANEELGDVGKERVRYDMRTLWKEDFKAMESYAMKDANLCVLIDEKIGLTDLLIELRKLSGVIRLNQLYSGTRKVRLPSLKPETFVVLRKFKDKYVFPSKTYTSESEDEHYKGTPPMEPIPGVYENLAVFDFTSLHPTIIMAGNISYETYDPENGDLDFGGNRFRSSPPGIIPLTLRDLMDVRLKYKEAYKKTGDKVYFLKDFVYKRVLNRFYGAMAYPGWFLYRRECAEAVTWIARNLLDFVKNKLAEEGYQVIYSATDSIFVPLKRQEDIEWIPEYVNETLKEDFCPSLGLKPIFNLELQKLYDKFFIGKKKNKYFGIVNGELNVMGFSGKKSDSPIITELIQRNVMRMILRGASEDEVSEYVAWEIQRVRAGRYPPTALSFRKGIGKELDEYKVPPLHVRAMKYSMEHLGMNWSTAEKPRIIYVKPPKNMPETDVIAFFDKLPKGFEIDYDRVIDRFIIKKIEEIFEGLGWDLTRVLNPDQSRLTKWVGGEKG